MKEIRVEDAVGEVLCHDITEIVKDGVKGARFRKGHIICAEDIPVLHRLGKAHIFIFEQDAALLHENDAAELLCSIAQNQFMERSEVREGKIELRATVDGVFMADASRIDALNELEDVCIATLTSGMPVKAGMKLSGMRVIPLMVSRAEMAEAQKLAGSEPLLSLHPYRRMKVGVVTTGSEVASGLIEDTFTPVLEAKLKAFHLKVDAHRISDDATEHTEAAIRELLALGMDMVLCTGGMSVDPDDRTPAAIRNVAARVVTYGAPVLPGAMFLVAYVEKGVRQIPILGLPGCVMHDPATVFDIFLPRFVAGIEVMRKDIRRLGVGGLCLNCKVCHYPVCSFGK